MRTFAIETLGCKVNQYESQQIRELLESLGLSQVSDYCQKPDLVVVNTCCVTRTASAKSRQCIRKARKLTPDAVQVVIGCLPTAQTGELNNLGENIHFIRHQDDLAAALNRIVESLPVRRLSHASRPQVFRPFGYPSIRPKIESKVKCKNNLSGQVGLGPLTAFKGHTRAFLKVQDGCDGFCSYCIIPTARPFVRSKPPETVLREAQALVSAGHREIVITGIFLGAYGQKSVRRKTWPHRQNHKLPELLDKIAEIPALERIRLSSLEPSDVTGQLLDTFRNHRNLMPHLHLSLQSGSNAVLRKMCRQYTADDFAATVEQIKAKLDRPAITTDIIVGFPGETDADFERTVQLARRALFAKMHIFRFSPRRGTAAAAMQEPVDNKVIKERSKLLRDLDVELGAMFRRQFIGETATILLENTNGRPSGRSERYFMVALDREATNYRKNDLVTVRLLENNNPMLGTAI